MKIYKSVNASTSDNTEIVFTPAAVLNLLAKIEEFKEFDFGLTESLNGTLQLQVNDSVYDLTSESTPTDIEVEEAVVDEVASINEETYEVLVEDETVSELESIESGIIKEALKTLAIGGLVRLGKHYLIDK